MSDRSNWLKAFFVCSILGLLQVPGIALTGHWIAIFAAGWCGALAFASLVQWWLS